MLNQMFRGNLEQTADVMAYQFAEIAGLALHQIITYPGRYGNDA